jgi:KEOPS complex subunit Cgi121
LLKHIKEFEKYALMSGFKNAKIANLEAFLKATRKENKPDTQTQFFNAQLIASWEHLYFAALYALTAFKDGESISRNLAIEAMLYASAQRQITKAMELIGIKPDSRRVAVLIVGENPESLQSALATVAKNAGAQPDDAVLKLTREKMACIRKAFGISNQELKASALGESSEKATVELVIERMALLTTQR